MRAVVQRVSHAKVEVRDEVVGKIGQGLLVLLGIGEQDTKEKVELLAEKISKLRIISDSSGKMNLSVIESKASVLVVSQFTLYADTKKGNRPSFAKAAKPKMAEKLYDHFIELLKEKVPPSRQGHLVDVICLII